MAPERLAHVLSLAALLGLLPLLTSPSLALMTHAPPAPTPRQLCEPGVKPPSNRFNSTESLRLLRNKMRLDLGADWYLETGLNRMLSSPQPSEDYRPWISGFTGSSGQLLITDTTAYLFTDTRYTVQADQELDCHWQFYDTTSLRAWISAYNSTNSADVKKLAVDARQIRASDYENLRNPLVTLVPLQKNPIDELWTNGRPQPVTQEIYPLPLIYTGKTWQAKVDQTRQAMSNGGADFLAVTNLAETAYLLNLRATVLANVPYFPSMVLLSTKLMVIFLDNPNKFLANETLRQHLNLASDGSCEPTAQICSSLHSMANLSVVATEVLRNTSRVWLDDASCSYSVLSALSGSILLRKTTPVQLAKAVKNSAEQMAFARCSLLDSAALVAFLNRMEENIAKGQSMTELSASALLATYRAKVPDFRGLSFTTIAASGPNAAVIHYRPTLTTDRAITQSEAFLLDSGGQYLGCTTDVTRTLYYGAKPPSEVRQAYTRVLMGVVDLFNLTWPKNLHSRNFDPFARHNLWAVGRDYAHGTGHGIGLFLGVHEGPNGIGRDLALVEGNFQSIEPGFYQREAQGVLGFGIRLETITGVKLVSGGSYLRFDPVTWVPFERKLIDTQLMSADQLRWLNWYHAECRTRLTNALKEIGEDSAAAMAWLTAATEPIVVDGEVKTAPGLRSGGSIGQLLMAAVATLVLVSASCR